MVYNDRTDGDALDGILDAGSGGAGNAGCSFANASNVLDTGYTYRVDLSQASNSSSFQGGIATNGYIAYTTYVNPNNVSAHSNSSNSGSNPLENIVYTDKVIGQMQSGDFHGFPPLVDNYGALGEKTTIIGGDGMIYTQLRMAGSYLGYDGHFEYMWNSKIVCNHRYFSRR